MKVAKKILIVLAALIALPLVIALFISKSYAVEREVVINKPKQEVFDYVKSLKKDNSIVDALICLFVYKHDHQHINR